MALARGQGAKPGFRILLYHAVGTRLPWDFYGISIAPSVFGRQLALLRGTPGLELVDLRSPESRHAGLRVAVTFDDGYKDNLYAAAPALQAHGIPFTVFVVTSFVREGRPEYLSEGELKEIAALPGATVGSHGLTHARLADCDDDTLRCELVESRQYLEDVLGKSVTAISYPHGAVDGRVRQAAERAGYDVGVCSRFDVNQPGRDPLLLCRTEITSADSERVFLQKLNGAWDWCRWRRPDPAGPAGKLKRAQEVSPGSLS